MDLGLLLTTFAAIFVVELPDKTFIATLVLSTRFRALPVWLGVASAFAVQSLVAVSLGSLVTLLPSDLVHSVAAAIFLIGAVLLIREAPNADAEEAEAEEEFAERAGAGTRAAFLTSFLVLFAAEWGDLTQLLTISLVGKYGDPVSVFAGAWTALLAVSALAVLAGRFLLRHIRLALIHYLGAAVCLLLASVTIYDLVR